MSLEATGHPKICLKARHPSRCSSWDLPLAFRLTPCYRRAPTRSRKTRQELPILHNSSKMTDRRAGYQEYAYFLKRTPSLMRKAIYPIYSEPAKKGLHSSRRTPLEHTTLQTAALDNPATNRAQSQFHSPNCGPRPVLHPGFQQPPPSPGSPKPCPAMSPLYTGGNRGARICRVIFTKSWHLGNGELRPLAGPQLLVSATASQAAGTSVGRLELHSPTHAVLVYRRMAADPGTRVPKPLVWVVLQL